jgi:hypothetical protein
MRTNPRRSFPLVIEPRSAASLSTTAASEDGATALKVGLRSKAATERRGPFMCKLLHRLGFYCAPQHHVVTDSEDPAVAMSHSVGSRHA